MNHDPSEIVMPDLSKHVVRGKKIERQQVHGVEDGRIILSSGPEASKTKAVQVFRAAFLALARPVRPKQPRNAPDGVLAQSAGPSSDDLDIYRVAPQNSDAYHGYLGSLRRSSFRNGDDTGISVGATSVPGVFEMSATSPLVYEMDGNSSWPIDMTGDTTDTSVLRGRVEVSATGSPSDERAGASAYR
jgi:hypothetical protein